MTREGIVHGKMEADGRKTITQGIGIIRETANFAKARVDGALVGENRETVEMVHYLLHHEGMHAVFKVLFLFAYIHFNRNFCWN